MKTGFKDMMETIEVPCEKHMQETIQCCMKAAAQKPPRTTRITFMYTQLYFLKSKCWLISLLLLALSWCLLRFFPENSLLPVSIWVSLLPLCFHMITIPLLMKSVDAKTMEIEQVTYHRYRSVLILRILCISLIHLLLISFCMLFSCERSALSFQQLLYFALVPYNTASFLTYLCLLMLPLRYCSYGSLLLHGLLTIALFLFSHTALYQNSAYLILWKGLFLLSLLGMLTACACVIRHADAPLMKRRNLLWN